jgi:2,4'-dihydroxyacetophenone dioxygenase
MEIPFARHRGEAELPFVEFEKGVDLQALHIDIEHSLWVVRMRMVPGATLPKHMHTGPVYAFTLAGSWRYLEYPEINTAGSYLFEPAGSVHTFSVLESNTGITDAWFAVHGANLNLDEDGKTVISVMDAGVIMKVYLSRCLAMGLPRPDIIGCEKEAAAYWVAKGGI